jgi:hypothetical protein
MAANEIYIYGFVPNFYGAEFFRSLKSIGVNFISFQNISAVVSDQKATPFDFFDRESLAHLLVHHQKTIESIMAIGFDMILPMKLGSMVQTKNDVLNILAKGYDLILATLKGIEHLIEIDLAVTWVDFSRALQDTANHPDVIAMKNNILNKTNNISQVDQIKVGKLVHDIMNEKNKQVELKIIDALSSFSLGIKKHETMDGQMITNSAFLVNRGKKEKFEQIIEQFDEKFDGALNFKLVGPLPCYSFYTIEIKELDMEYVVQAGKELGLKNETSEHEIKKAYQEKARMFHPDTYLENDSEENFNNINKAYHTLLDYIVAVRQSSKGEYISLAKEILIENLILVKIKE